MSIIKANPYDRIFSYGYPQFSNDPKIFYTFLKNSHPRYRAEIRDIYFSAPFSYEFNGVKIFDYPFSHTNIFNINEILSKF